MNIMKITTLSFCAICEKSDIGADKLGLGNSAVV